MVPQACLAVCSRNGCERCSAPEWLRSALADAAPFLDQLAGCGIQARVETEVLGFDFDDFDSAWDALAGVTTAQLSPERQEEAKAAVRETMWPDPAASRSFRNTVQYIVGRCFDREGRA